MKNKLKNIHKATYKKILSIGIIILVIMFLSYGDSYENVNGDEVIEGFFNKSISRKYGNRSWGNINLESELLEMINEAKESIDVCIYEINLPDIVEGLIEKASQGVRVRVIVDGKEGKDEYREKRYTLMRIYLEKMIRGKDGVIGNDDDIMVFSDSPIFMVQESKIRDFFGLKKNINENERYKKLTIGKKNVEGYVLCYGEEISEGVYSSPGNQMHNKFVIVDKEILWTGSWNFTVTGLYGTYDDAIDKKLDGNQQHCIKIRNSEVSKFYLEQFNEMWGSEGREPNKKYANFGKRKTLRGVKSILIGDIRVDIYFSPNNTVMDEIKKVLNNNQNEDMFFSLFCISEKEIMEILKRKNKENKGNIFMVIDEGMWNQNWSAIRRVGDVNEFIPIFEDRLKGKLHSKSAVINPFGKENIVITGSMNWTVNGYRNNDENIMIIYGDSNLSRKFFSEIMSRVRESSF
ncbi:phospholipase D-like domain-containing protein [Oceanirhabdus sp. W0125-5]|uniref:phospholipase D-like domain-containing protein n=1 Tax=Oceanirhabdus sp. W0125-5 TaxID=2999116 RepID=UPI0022F326A3|nr:phospholipase D-like domain-containing protein [Oceanirhabdus sp. W0125-5]WBW96165.1 phospholipase D-like domain-containing protein [Oceanirhabdus sp. W0125-5]